MPVAASASPYDRLSRMLRREAPRRLLWLPVALAGGIGSYFSLPGEPSAFAGPAIGLAGLSVALLLRRSVVVAWLALLVVAAGIGLSVAQWRTSTVATAMLERETWTTVVGRVVAIEQRPAGWRFTLDRVALTPIADPVRTPTGVRVTVAGRRQDQAMEHLRIGDVVRMRARLQPPSPPVAPGAYDFQRDAYFRRIGAVGFAVSHVERVAEAPRGSGDGAWAHVDRIRAAASRRVRAALPDPAGAVAAAMLLGDRAGIDEPTTEAFRETGLAHLLAISGLHMGLVAGTVYASIRTALAAWPAVALRRPIKKWAAVAALVAAALYLVLAGAPVPTQRAFLMTGLILGAVLLDREAISLHLVAWAAAAVLLVAPEALIGPSFQLSFAAVTALIAAWEAVAIHRRARPGQSRGWLRRSLGYVGGVAATSAVASLVTAPVVAHHFQQVPLLGAVANLIAVPVTAFVTMPAGVAALLAMPVGLEYWPLRVMGWGIDSTLWAANVASEAPLTAVGVPALGTAPLVLLAVGGLWLALWRTTLRWFGAAVILAGAVAAWAEQQPDALFAADGTLAAVRIPGVGWAVSDERGGSFVREAWQRRWGGQSAAGFLAADDTGADGFGCDGLGCVLRVDGQVLAMPASPEAAAEDCQRADILVTAVRLRSDCATGIPVFDRNDLRSGGALAVWMSASGIRTRSVANARGSRPWVVE